MKNDKWKMVRIPYSSSSLSEVSFASPLFRMKFVVTTMIRAVLTITSAVFSQEKISTKESGTKN